MSFIIVLIAAFGMGTVMLKPVELDDPLEGLSYRLLCGLVPVAAMALVIGSYSLAWAQYAIGGVAFFSVAWSLRPGTPRERQPQKAHFAALNFLEKASITATLAAWGLSLLGALAPATGWDATVAHLALPAAYNRAGYIITDPGNVYSGYPHFMHALYAVAYLGSHELPVSLLNWTLGCLACLSLYALGRRIGTRQTGLVTAALLATAPIYLDQAGNVGIDLPFMAYSTAALAALVTWHEDRNRPWLLLAGLLAGASCGIRHTGYIVCLLLAIGVIGMALRTRPFKHGALFSSTAALAASVWLVRSWLVTGNPLFPFLLSCFPPSPIDHIAVTAPGVHESIGRSSGMGLVAFLRFPWDIVMRPALYDGWNKSPGGMILVLGVPGLVLGGTRARWLGAFSAAGGTFFFFFQRLARYLLPFFAPMMVVAALAVERMPQGRRVASTILVFSFLYGLGFHAAAVHVRIPVVLGRQTKMEYLTSRVERYGAFVYANQRLNDGGKILTLDQRSYYLDGPSYQNHWSLKRIAGVPLGQQVAWLHEHQIRYVMIPEDFVTRSGALSGEIATMLGEWQRSPQYFELKDMPLQLPRRGEAGVEKVSFYVVR